MSKEATTGNLIGALFSVMHTLMSKGQWKALILLYEDVVAENDQHIQFYLSWLIGLHWVWQSGVDDMIPRASEYRAALCSHVARILTAQGEQERIDAVLKGLRHDDA